MMSLLDQFQSNLKEFSLRKGSRFFVACSGGVDSVVLLHLLCELKKEYPWKFCVIHYHHGLRGKEASADARFVKALAKKWKIPFILGKGNVQEYAKQKRFSIEEAARHMRYDFMCEAAKKKKIKKVLLAHNLNDQAETVLMRIVKGTGLRGLRGIRPQMKMKGINFLRPLLAFEKKEILKYARANKIKYRQDASNRSKKFLRNRLRLDIVPYLEKNVNPRVLEALSRVPRIVEQEILLLERLEDAAWKRVAPTVRKGKIGLSREKWQSLEEPIQYRVLNRALGRLDPASGLSHQAWVRLEKKLSGKKYRCSLARNIDFVLTPSKIELYKQ